MCPSRLSGLKLVLAITLLPAAILSAEQTKPAALALTVSTNTFLPLGRWPEYPVPPGLYARAGLGWLPGSRLELELFQVPRLVPEPYSEAFTGISAGFWMLERKRNSYFNLTADLSWLCGQTDGVQLPYTAPAGMRDLVEKAGKRTVPQYLLRLRRLQNAQGRLH